MAATPSRKRPLAACRRRPRDSRARTILYVVGAGREEGGEQHPQARGVRRRRRLAEVGAQDEPVAPELRDPRGELGRALLVEDRRDAGDGDVLEVRALLDELPLNVEVELAQGPVGVRDEELLDPPR